MFSLPEDVPDCMEDCFRKAAEEYGRSSNNWDMELKIRAECACDPATECTFPSSASGKAITALAKTCCNPVYGVENWASFVGEPDVCDKLIEEAQKIEHDISKCTDGGNDCCASAIPENSASPCRSRTLRMISGSL